MQSQKKKFQIKLFDKAKMAKILQQLWDGIDANHEACKQQNYCHEVRGCGGGQQRPNCEQKRFK